VDVASGLTMQGPVRQNVVTVMEKWENLESLRKHLQAPHMLLYRPRVKDFVVDTKLQVLVPVDGKA
jgi:quinol monooxygenase YgiN